MSHSQSYVPRLPDDDGPRVVPIIAQGRVCTCGAMGHLRCLQQAVEATQHKQGK